MLVIAPNIASNRKMHMYIFKDLFENELQREGGETERAASLFTPPEGPKRQLHLGLSHRGGKGPKPLGLVQVRCQGAGLK